MKTAPTKTRPSRPASLASQAQAQPQQLSFDELVAQHRGRLITVAKRIVIDRELAEDIAQETLLVAWRSLDELRDPASLRAWLTSIARNKAKMVVRKHHRESLFAEPELLVASDRGAASPLDEVLNQEVARYLQRLLDELPPGYREPLVLFYYQLCSVRQISQQLGISDAAVKQRLSRGREKLRNRLWTQQLPREVGDPKQLLAHAMPGRQSSRPSLI